MDWFNWVSAVNKNYRYSISIFRQIRWLMQKKEPFSFKKTALNMYDRKEKIIPSTLKATVNSQGFVLI
jgi:hypothetical protein